MHPEDARDEADFARSRPRPPPTFTEAEAASLTRSAVLDERANVEAYPISKGAQSLAADIRGRLHLQPRNSRNPLPSGATCAGRPKAAAVIWEGASGPRSYPGV